LNVCMTVYIYVYTYECIKGNIEQKKAKQKNEDNKK
jgi:hypothetical protein